MTIMINYKKLVSFAANLRIIVTPMHIFIKTPTSTPKVTLEILESFIQLGKKNISVLFPYIHTQMLACIYLFISEMEKHMSMQAMLVSIFPTSGKICARLYAVLSQKMCYVAILCV